jgi:hypothetical protein
MTSTEDKPTTKVNKQKFSEGAILSMLYQQVDRVENTIKESVINVYSNRYRVNIWQGTNNPFLPKAGKIVASYFISVEDNGKIKIFDDGGIKNEDR